MGEVWKGRDTRLGREVAIKVLPADLSADVERLKRFEREARAASSLSHPNIVTIHEVGRVDSTSFIVMELVDGKTLRALLAEGALPVRRLLPIATQIADGLAKAHEAGIVHRDLKPENVMMTRDGLVKILDFGLAKLAHPETESGQTASALTVSAATRPGIAMGTAGYMSPEQASGHPVDFRSDQFSLGSMLYEMVTGRPAFRRATTAQTLAAIIEDDPEPIPSLAPRTPAPLRWVVERCLSKEPENRYAATRDLVRDLSSLRDHLSELSSGSGVEIGALGSRRLFHRLPIVATLALLAGIGVGVVVSHRPREEPPLYRRLTFRRGGITGARFAPDGQTIVYSARWQGRPMQLFSTRTDSTESTQLPLPSADILSISSSGKMAIALSGERVQTVAEVSLAGGAPREILDGFWEDPGFADWSPDGQNLAIVRKGRLEFPIGKVLYESRSPNAYLGLPRFSPDGKSIAFLERSAVGEVAIDLIDLSGRKTTLSRGWSATLGLAWNPKTDEVWFSARELSGGEYGGLVLHAVSRSGQHRVVARAPGSLVIDDISREGRVLLAQAEFSRSMMCLPPGATKEKDLTWLDFSTSADLSEDGKTILLDDKGITNGSAGAVYLRKTDGSPAVRLGEGVAAALSPDGKWAISVAPKGEGLVLLPTGPGERKVIPGEGMSYLGAKCFPDGKRILFSASAAGRPSRLYVQDVSGGAPRPLTPEGFEIGPVSPDGKLVATRGPDQEVVLYPVEGGEPHAVPGIGSDDDVIRWDAKGEALYLAKGSRVDRFVLSTGRRELWKEIAPAESDVMWMNVQLTPDGKSYVYTYLRDIDFLYLVDGLR
jgi:serine/threonine protein kinase